MIGTYYYNSVQQSISARFTELNNVFTDESADTTTDFLSTAQKYIEDFPEKEQMELQSVNSIGRVTLTSTGFLPDKREKMPDLDEALKSGTGEAITTGQLSTGEDIMAGTRIFTSQDGTVIGAIRFVTSMSDINITITLLILLSLIHI